MKSLDFGTAPSKGRSSLTISAFRGVDLTDAPANVKESRSPEAPNMMRDQPGKVKKRTGYQTQDDYGASINGVHFLQKADGTRVRIVHAGNNLYDGDSDSTPIYTDMINGRSVAWQMGGKLWILDGLCYLCYDGATVQPVENIAYVPEVRIACTPASGAGTTHEPVNLLSAYRKQGYIADGTALYTLAYDDLSDDPVTVSLLDANGDWTDYAEDNTAHPYAVDRENGTVTFSGTPPAVLVAGQDNVRITYGKTSHSDVINYCCLAMPYGIAGASNQLFVTGNMDYRNRDYYSAIDDPTYFGDVWYSVLGQDDSSVMGYSITNNYLTAHKDGGADGRNIIIRSGQLVAGETAFPIFTTLNGAPTVSPYAFAFLASEPLFLTPDGVQAITAADVTGEKYSNDRSFYINKVLTSRDLEDAFAFVWNGFYLLAVGQYVFLLDGLQKTYEKNAPMSSFQYECYFWTNIRARVMWEENGLLWFGTSQGKIARFYEDDGSPDHFNDDGEAIEAYWELPDFTGDDFYRNKTIRYIAVKLASAIRTGVDIWVLVRGIWKQLREDNGAAQYFSWSNITWSRWTWRTDTSPKTLGKKIKLKKIDQARFRLQNDALNEPFGLYEVALEYTESGYYKK